MDGQHMDESFTVERTDQCTRPIKRFPDHFSRVEQLRSFEDTVCQEG